MRVTWRRVRQAVGPLQRHGQQRIATRRLGPRRVREARDPDGIVAGAYVVDAPKHVHAGDGQSSRCRALEQARELCQCVVQRDLADDRREPREFLEGALPTEQGRASCRRLPAEVRERPSAQLRPAARCRAAHAAAARQARRRAHSPIAARAQRGAPSSRNDRPLETAVASAARCATLRPAVRARIAPRAAS